MVFLVEESLPVTQVNHSSHFNKEPNASGSPSWETTQWLGCLNSDPHLSVQLAGIQKERKQVKKKKKNTPVASKDEPTQFLSVKNTLEDKVWSYRVWIRYSACPLMCGLQLGTNCFFLFCFVFNIYLAASSLSFRAQTL